MKDHYDYLVVGCGLFGATFAEQAKKHGKSVLIIDKRNHIGGNVYTKEIEGIHVHTYGAHIFHTSYDNVWEYVNTFATFNNFINNVIAEYKGERYHLPFNMNTFFELWGVNKEEEARAIIARQIKEANIKEVTNLEEQAISLVGTDVYHKLIKGYTEKQWGRDCKDLPSFIIKRLPLRFTYDNNYFNDKYQGIPIGGYTKMVSNMIKGVDLLLNTKYEDFKAKNPQIADKIIFTGPIDEYFKFSLGKLEYRTVTFKNELLNQKDYQGNAVINYTEREVPYTRIIEHKYFDFHDQDKTYISKEYPSEYKEGMEPYYPVNNERNTSLYNAYLELAKKEANVFFKGRLGEYKYYDMDDVILSALEFAKEELK
ncbi:MAG: UDP-galactopyranose mutase [Bacilli bacterium]|nr:UDP-galactopyranose mutase [Bacilli bacterium]